ncbi:S41 family peptidase [Brachybacterium sp. AOP25-B2-12]|uniref:S41 family peptidase n=1 Tax=Brachybacterium sp. AOP25-B2-12 TaxID=3457710 RepID=UPI004033DFF6
MTSTSTAPPVSSPASPAYLRYPDVRGDLVAFVAADDLWAAPYAGGHAWRLTDDGAPVLYPRISPDGSLVAYTSLVTGRKEVHLVASDGTGAPRRLTHWGNRHTRVAGWHEDGRIIVTTGHGAALSSRDAQMWALTTDGAAELLPLGRGSEVAFHPSGTTVVTTMWRNDVSRWKHYQGGTAARLWISHEDVPLDAPAEVHAARTWEPLRDDLLASKWRTAFVGDRLVFASDTPGEGAEITDRATSNLWSVALDGTDLRAHTHLTSADGYLREPASDGTRIVYTSRGRLFALDSLDAAPHEIPVITAGVASARRPHRADPHQNLLALRPTHDARASVAEWRGTAHVLTHRGGPARLLAGRSGLRIREAAPLGRSAFAVFVTDEDAQHDRLDGSVGSDALGLRRLDAGGEELRLDVGQIGRILHAIPSPDGSRIALSTQDGVVRVVSLRGVEDPSRTSGPDAATAHETPSEPVLDGVREVGRSHDGEIAHLTWSPDSRYLVWAEPTSEYTARLMLTDVQDPEPSGRALTHGTFGDSAPAFSVDGKHLGFISARTFDTVYDDLVFDLSFVNAQRPYLLPLAHDTRDPFGPEPDGWALSAPAAAGGADGPGTPGADGATDAPAAPATEAPATAASAAGAAESETPPRTVIDLEGADDRIVPFPVESGDVSSLTAVKAGFVWLRHPQQVVLGSTRAFVEGEPPKPTLELWNLSDRKLVTLAEGVDAVTASGDGEHLVIRQGTAFVQIPADRKVEDDDPARIAIDTARLRLTIDPVAERRGMLWDNYRLMAQQYWRSDMDGQDWHAMTRWYDEAIDRVVTDDDFADLLWETVGELGTSHAYVMNTPWSPEHTGTPGFLGADLAREGDRWVLTRILAGESSDPEARSPLLAPGAGARVGDAIVQVDGQDVDPATGVAPLLVGSADTPTEIVLEAARGEGGDEALMRRRIVVVPLPDDAELRYQDWVASRRRYVEERSGGRLGYLHIPDMVSSGWAQMHRDLRTAAAREGIVVDVRYNSGGHTSQLVTDRLARTVVSWGYPRGQRPDTYPAFAPRGPVVFVTNQEAGSDGDIVGAVAKAMRIGPVIGTRTWGGVIGIDGRFDLVDGTGVTQPKYASWFRGVDWSIENYGVDPDIEVPFPPNAWTAGIDPQLARGVDEALERLAQTPAATAPPLPPARFAPRQG